MNDQSRMSDQVICPDTLNVISSRASVDGLTPSDSLGGLTTDPSGQEVARANLSPRQAKDLGLLTSGTYGPRGSISLSSGDLTRCLASRYREKTEGLGSTLFRLTWKESTTPSGRLIFVQQASAHRTKGTDFTSLPTPNASETRDCASPQALARADRGGSFGEMDLQSILDSPFVSRNSFPQPLLRKMDDGFDTRVGRISAYGNAIVPQVAAEFIQACTGDEQ